MSIYSKYNWLQTLYWFGCCCAMGFIAVFLSYCGLNNTEVGIASGGGCVLSIFLSPYISGLTSKLKSISLQKMMIILLVLSLACFVIITYIPMPAILIMAIYIFMYALMLAAIPIMTMIAMNYLEKGERVDFGTARGMGSTSWAVSALVFGKIIDWFNPTVLTIGYVITCVLIVALLVSMPAIYQSESNAQDVDDTIKAQGSIFEVVKKYKIFMLILVGFMFMFIGATSLSTYLINIITNLGGDTTLCGIVMFAMAFSEMPIMSMSSRLVNKYNPVTLIAIAGFFYVVRNIGICYAPNLILMIIFAMMQGVSYALLTGVITYYVNYHLDRPDRMSGQTLIGIMTTGIGSMVGNVLGGILQDNFGINAMYIFISVCTILGAVVLFYAKKVESATK